MVKEEAFTNALYEILTVLDLYEQSSAMPTLFFEEKDNASRELDLMALTSSANTVNTICSVLDFLTPFMNANNITTDWDKDSNRYVVYKDNKVVDYVEDEDYVEL